jgi:hypothetical protein
MPKYAGHKNWNHWNVSLWLNNTETLYFAMQTWIKASKNKDTAARAMLYALTSGQFGPPTKETPDGARYTFSSVRAAMRD